MLFFTTSSAPPDAEPEITLISLPPEVCQALMAGFGPTYAASSWPASRAVASSVPVLNGYSFSVTFLPRSLVKWPSLIPTSALAWVMFSRNPSRRVTGAEEPPEFVVEFDVPEELDELHPAAASKIAAPAPAAISVFLIVRLFSSFFSIKIIGFVGNLLYHRHLLDTMRPSGRRIRAGGGVGEGVFDGVLLPAVRVSCRRRRSPRGPSRQRTGTAAGTAAAAPGWRRRRCSSGRSPRRSWSPSSACAAVPRAPHSGCASRPRAP